MERIFQRTTVSFSTLCYAMGQSLDEAMSHLKTFEKDHQLTLDQTFSFFMHISKGQTVNTLYMMYGVVPNTTKGSGPVQIVHLKHQNFITFDIPLDSYLAIGDDSFKNELTAYLKQENLKWDMSTVFTLIENKETYYKVYIPYKG